MFFKNLCVLVPGTIVALKGLTNIPNGLSVDIKCKEQIRGQGDHRITEGGGGGGGLKVNPPPPPP